MDKETENWRRCQRDTTLNIIRETELYCKFALAKETGKLIFDDGVVSRGATKRKIGILRLWNAICTGKRDFEKVRRWPEETRNRRIAIHFGQNEILRRQNENSAMFGLGQRARTRKFCGGKKRFRQESGVGQRDPTMKIIWKKNRIVLSSVVTKEIRSRM